MVSDAVHESSCNYIQRGHPRGNAPTDYIFYLPCIHLNFSCLVTYLLMGEVDTKIDITLDSKQETTYNLLK